MSVSAGVARVRSLSLRAGSCALMTREQGSGARRELTLRSLVADSGGLLRVGIFGSGCVVARALWRQTGLSDFVNQRTIANAQNLRCLATVPVVGLKNLQNQVAFHLATGLFG